MNPYPYPDLKEQFTVGDMLASVSIAYVLKMERSSGPALYFVKDIRYQPPNEYWSPVLAMAKRFGHFFLAVDFARYLETKPDYPRGKMSIKDILHRETVIAKAMRQSLTDVLQVPKDDKGFMAWLTTYKGVIRKKPEEPARVYRPQTENDVAAEIVRRYDKIVREYHGPKGEGREFL